MYNIKDGFFTKEQIDKVEITPEILATANIFKQKINLDKMSVRAVKALKQNNCETVGDAYYFIIDDPENLGNKTKEEIIFHVLYSFMQCKYAIEVQKAFELSAQPLKTIKPKRYYELCYFHGRKDTGSIYINTEINRDECMDDDEFLQKLVERNELEATEANSIMEINEVDKATYISFVE